MMDKLILGVLGLGLILGMFYAINFHFDDMLLWLADSDSAKPTSGPVYVGPLSR